MKEFSPPTFVEIKEILDFLVLGKEEFLKLLHGDSFGWETKEELLCATAPRTGTQYQLIAEDLIGNGRGMETNLYLALTVGVGGEEQMPFNGNVNGEYASEEQLSRIVEWIDAGCPD